MTDTQISVGMNVDGVVTGTEKAKRKISELGGAAREAGKGTGAIGDGMAGAATKVEAATKNMVGSIQRQIAALEAGDKSSRQYQESLARMRGIDVAALRPYLDQLDQMKLKQADAAAQQAHLAEGMGLVRSAALAGAAAVMAAAAGFVAFAKSSIDAADGMNDLSQRVGISVKELGKYQLAAEQSGASMDAIAKGVKGLAENMLKHGDALRKIGIDSKTADGAMQQLADVFAAMPDGMEKTTLATKMFGKAGMDLIPMLNLGSKGLAEAAEKSAKFADQMALAAPMADAFNDSMAEIGMYTKVAGMAMVNDMLPALVDISKAMSDAAQKGGILAGVMAGLDSLGNNLFDWNGNAQRKNIANLTSDLEDLRDKQNAITLDIFGKKGQIQAEIEAKIKALDDAKKAYFGITQGNAGRGSVNPASVKPAVDWGADYKGIMAAMGGDGSAKKAISEANKELEQQAKLLAELSGYTGDYEASQQRLAAMLKSGKLDQEAYNRAAQELVAKQPGMLAAAKAQAEALKEIAKLQADYEASLQKSVTAGADELAKAQAAYDAHGKLASVLQEELLARMEITREQIAGGAGSEAELSAIDAQIKAKRELVKVLRSGEVRDASEKVAKDAQAEWEKYADQIGQSLTDQLMEGGKSGAEYIENLFRTMILRPVIQALVTPIAQSVSSSIMSGGSGGGASGFNIFNSTSGLGDGMSVTLGKTASTLINNGYQQSGEALAGMAKAANTYSSQITMAGNALSYFSSAQSLADGKYGAAAGQAIGTYFGGPIGGSIGNAIGSAIDEAFGGGGGQKSDSSYNMGGFGDASATGLAGTYATGVEDAWKTLAKELEITTALQVGALTSIDTQGDAKTILRANATVDGVGVYDRATRMGTAENVGRSQEELQAAMAEETTRILFAALKASDLPQQYKTYLSTIGDSVADMTEAMTIVAVVDDFNDALQSLPFENLKNLSFDAAKGLIEAAGGLSALGANLSTYYTNFYSAEEQRAQTIKTINATVGNGFDAASTSAEQFRATVEAAMLDTSTEGLALTAKLLGVAGAMGTLTKESEAAAEAVRKESEAAAEALKKALADLFGSLDDAVSAALSAVEAAVSAERDALSAAYDTQAQQISDSIDTVSASVGKLQSLADSLKSTLDGMRISGSDAQYRAAAQAQISAALATARAGGGLPLDGQLTSALATVSKPSEQLFATYEDYARDFYSTANDISALGDLTNDQLSLEQATLAALETQSAILEASYKAQLSILDATLANAQEMAGKDSGLLTLAEALNALVNALSQKTYFEANPDVANAYAKNDYGLSAGEYATVHYGLYGKNEGRTSPNGAPADTAKSYFELYPDVAAAFAANAYGMDQIAYSARHFANFGKAEGRVFPGFAVGTNYVPSDMIAQIHEGEAIVPKAYNPAAGGQNNAELVAEIRALRQEVASLKASNEATAKATSKFASQFETASEGGRALLTEVYA